MNFLSLSLIFFSLFTEIAFASLANGFSEPIGTPYIISRKPPGAGFWSNFFMILGGIEEADKMMWTPVVDMERCPTLYNEQGPILGTMNAWEYFFEQPGGVSVQTALKMRHLNNNGGKDGVFSRATSIIPPNDRIIRAKQLIQKYIKIKQYILDELDSIIPPGVHSDILGVHVRGTDRRQGALLHLMTADADVYLESAKALDQTYHFRQIFLACDEYETVDMFLEAFGDRLIFTDAYRVSASTEIGYKPQDTRLKQWLHGASRPNHNYLLGREVLVDALLLARTGHLLCGPSNVSHAAIYFAESPLEIHEVASPGVYKGKK